MIARVVRVTILLLLVGQMLVIAPPRGASAEDQDTSKLGFTHGPLPTGWSEAPLPDDKYLYTTFTAGAETGTDWPGITVADLMPMGGTVEMCLAGEMLPKDGDNLSYWGTGDVRFRTGFPIEDGAFEAGSWRAQTRTIDGNVERWTSEMGWEPWVGIRYRSYCVDLPGANRAIGILAMWVGNQEMEVENFIRTFQFAGNELALCEEAWRYFGRAALYERFPDPSSPTKIRKSGDQLLVDIMTGISDYDFKHQDAPSYTSVSWRGTLRAIDWLGHEGGMSKFMVNSWSDRDLNLATPDDTVELISVNVVADEFSFNNPDDALLRWGGPGTEPALLAAIKARVDNDPAHAKLSPADVTYLALEQTKGDVRQAMLLVHNTMRSAGRDDAFLPGTGDTPSTGVVYEPSLFTDYLEPIRGYPGRTFANAQDAAENGDNAGPWYHLFGTTFFEMQAMGDIGVAPLAFGVLNMPRALLTSIYTSYLQNLFADEASMASDFSNVAEQWLRWVGGSEADPEKFCFNVWGAKIGHELHNYYSQRENGIRWGPPGAQKPAGPSTPQLPGEPPPAGQAPSLSSDTVHLDAVGPAAASGTSPDLYQTQSPVSVTWRGSSGELRLDQDTETLTGWYPLQLVPLLEPESETWGVTWVDLGAESHEIVFEASDDGTFTLLWRDGDSGRVDLWSAPVATGDVLTMAVDPRSEERELLLADGSAVAPIVSLTPDDEAVVQPPSGSDDEPTVGVATRTPESDQTGLIAKVIAGFVVLLGGALWLRSRGKRNQATKAAAASAPKQSRKRASAARRKPTISKQDAAGLLAGRQCSECGGQLTPSAKFCPTCGAVVPEPAQPPPPATVADSPSQVFCDQCGASVRPEARYCPRCGAGLPASAGVESVTPRD